MPSNKSFVETIKERCRVCYTCVRECPAKAIRISDGQAEIIGERCINCGNCVRVCSQRAKQVIGSIEEVRALLDSGAPTAVCLAPSFPAEFTDISPERLVGMLRRLGFSKVAEVAAGADLVADAYRKLLAKNDGARYIATTCPAVVTYVERYHPQLVDHLAPIVSPMIATARCLRRLYGPELRGRLRRPLHREKAGIAHRPRRQRDGRRPDFRRALADVRGGRDHARLRRAERVRPAARRFRRALLHQPRPAAGGGDRRGPHRRPGDRRRRPGQFRGRDQGVRGRHDGRAAARDALLHRLHHGRGHEQHAAAVRAARPHQRIRPRAPPARRPPRRPGRPEGTRRDSTSRAASRRTTSGSPCRRRTR